MSDEQKDLSSAVVEKRPLRPALIVSKRVVKDYSIMLRHLLVGLAEESIPAALVCPPGCDVDQIVSPSVEVIRHPLINLPLTGRRNRNMLIERLARFKPTVMHSLCETKARLTRRLSKRLNLPYVQSVNSIQTRWKHFVCQKRTDTFSVSSGRCAKIIVPAESIAKNLEKIHPGLAGRIKHINIGTFAEDQACCFSNLSALPSMVVAHPFNDVRDFENLFSAVRHLGIDGYEFMLVVIGQGRAERQLRKMLGALGLSQIVTIVPRLSPWRSFLDAGDIFILPQPKRSFDAMLLEAMSVGTAVAACKGGVDDLIIDGETSVIFDPGDELSIMAALQRLFDRREIARQLAEGAQQHVRKNHSVSKMISLTIQTYRDAQQWYGR